MTSFLELEYLKGYNPVSGEFAIDAFSPEYCQQKLTIDYPVYPLKSDKGEVIFPERSNPSIKVDGFTFLTWLERRNLLNDINFFNKLDNKEEYVAIFNRLDSIPYIYLLADLFPNVTFHLYNWKSYIIKYYTYRILANPLEEELYSDKSIEFYSSLKKKIVYIGDSLSDFKTDIKIMKRLRPFRSMIELNPSLNDKTIVIPRGDIYFQPYNEVNSSSTKLVIDENNLDDYIEYDCIKHVLSLSYYNNIARRKKLNSVSYEDVILSDLFQGLVTDKYKMGIDFLIELFILSDYVLKNNSGIISFEKVRELLEKINNVLMKQLTFFQEYLYAFERKIEPQNLLYESRERYKERFAYALKNKSVNNEVDSRKWVNNLLLGTTYDSSYKSKSSSSNQYSDKLSIGKSEDISYDNIPVKMKVVQTMTQSSNFSSGDIESKLSSMKIETDEDKLAFLQKQSEKLKKTIKNVTGPSKSTSGRMKIKDTQGLVVNKGTIKRIKKSIKDSKDEVLINKAKELYRLRFEIIEDESKEDEDSEHKNSEGFHNFLTLMATIKLIKNKSISGVENLEDVYEYMYQDKIDTPLSIKEILDIIHNDLLMESKKLDIKKLEEEQDPVNIAETIYSSYFPTEDYFHTEDVDDAEYEITMI